MTELEQPVQIELEGSVGVELIRVGHLTQHLCYLLLFNQSFYPANAVLLLAWRWTEGHCLLFWLILNRPAIGNFMRLQSQGFQTSQVLLGFQSLGSMKPDGGLLRPVDRLGLGTCGRGCFLR